MDARRLLFFLFLCSILSVWAQNDTLLLSEGERNGTREEEETSKRNRYSDLILPGTMKRHSLRCTSRENLLKWHCHEACTQETDEPCRVPNSNDLCFDSPITYNYSMFHGLVYENVRRFDVVAQFPRCWQYLKPLLCAIVYRPCRYDLYHNQEVRDREGYRQQSFRRDFCLNAIRECSFLSDRQLWPSFLNCDDDGLFNDRCERRYVEISSEMRSSQCIHPLVDVSQSAMRDQFEPIVDTCVLPCRTTLIGSENDLIGFHIAQLIFSLIISLASLGLFMWLYFLSEIYLQDDFIFALTHALFCSFVHWAVWATVIISSFSVCGDNGARIPFAAPRGLWCNLQAWILHTTLLAGGFWMATFVCLCPPESKRFRRMTIWIPDINRRNVLFFLVYVMACFITCVLIMFKAIRADTNGITGICHVGASFFEQALFWIYVPLFLVTLTLIGAAGRVAWIHWMEIKGERTKKGNDEMEQGVLMTPPEENLTITVVEKKPSERISVFWLGALAIVSVLSLLLGIWLHVGLSRIFGQEREAVVHLVDCTLQTKLTEDNAPIVSTGNFNTTSSLDSKSLQLHQRNGACFISALLQSYRWNVLWTFILLPALPYILLMVMVLQGLRHRGWFHLREHINPCYSARGTTRVDDVEMKPLSVHEEEEQDAFPSGHKGRFSSSERLAERTQAPSPMPSKTLSEPTAERSNGNHQRRIDLLQRGAERRNRRGPLNHRSSPDANIDQTVAAIIHPPVESSSGSSFNMVSASAQNLPDPVLQLQLRNAYELGLREGQWMERCNRQQNQMVVMNDLIQRFDTELRRHVDGPSTSTAISRPTQPSVNVNPGGQQQSLSMSIPLTSNSACCPFQMPTAMPSSLNINIGAPFVPPVMATTVNETENAPSTSETKNETMGGNGKTAMKKSAKTKKKSSSSSETSWDSEEDERWVQERMQQAAAEMGITYTPSNRRFDPQQQQQQPHQAQHQPNPVMFQPAAPGCQQQYVLRPAPPGAYTQPYIILRPQGNPPPANVEEPPPPAPGDPSDRQPPPSGS